jgi:hypothetical protein
MWINLYLTSNDKDATDLSIGKDDWGQLKAGISFQKYASCDTGAVTCELQILEQLMDEKFTSDVSEEEEREVDDDGGKGEPP